MKRVVTLWHWTIPLWLVHEHGGWHKKEMIDLFVRYCKKVTEELGEEIDLLITLNEPRLPLNKGYLTGEFPPGKRNPLAFLRARRNMVKAHRKCYETIKKDNKNIQVGITQYTNDFDFVGGLKSVKFLTEKIEDFYNWHFFEKIGDAQDFIGVNYYYGYDYRISFSYPFAKRIRSPEVRSDLNWEFSPEGLHEVVMDAWKKYKLPIYIFENGAADAEDKIRSRYIKEHLRWLHRSIKRKADVRGYFYWSLFDNFEWVEGFWPRFGLCKMNYKTMERKPRSSYYFYQKIIKQNGLEDK